MSIAIVVTRNVPDRYRGFLASVLLEISPGTYVGPRISRGVRERVWSVCEEWSSLLPTDGCVTMLWVESNSPGGLRIVSIGAPKTDLLDHDGVWLDHHPLTAAHAAALDPRTG